MKEERSVAEVMDEALASLAKWSDLGDDLLAEIRVSHALIAKLEEENVALKLRLASLSLPGRN